MFKRFVDTDMIRKRWYREMSPKHKAPDIYVMLEALVTHLGMPLPSHNIHGPSPDKLIPGPYKDGCIAAEFLIVHELYKDENR